MACALLNGSSVSVDELTDAQIEAAVIAAVYTDNHAAQNASGETDREWFASYCDLTEKLHGRAVVL